MFWLYEISVQCEVDPAPGLLAERHVFRRTGWPCRRAVAAVPWPCWARLGCLIDCFIWPTTPFSPLVLGIVRNNQHVNGPKHKFDDVEMFSKLAQRT